jgi:tRNA pseudouridine55 synthase
MVGIFNVNKPVGITSHDVVQRVRKVTNVRRVGHTGTLDPLASGVLVILVGRRATRLARFLFGSDKVYRAVIRLGEVTPTYDAESEVTARRPVDVGRTELAAALAGFRGEIEQVPPMYSALKKDGKPLYELARQGKTVARQARQVTIHELELSAWNPPELTLNVACSAGTYIRSLAHDLGEALGCGAHLRALVRTASGPFRLEESRTPEELETLAVEGQLETALQPPKVAFADKPSVQLTAEQVAHVRHGRTITLDAAPDVAYLPALGPHGQLVGVLVPRTPTRWRPTLVLASAG